jgi:hypothetical protein
MNPSPQQPGASWAITESLDAIIATYDGDEDEMGPSGKVPNPNPRHPVPGPPTMGNALAIMIQVDCGEESVVPPKPKSPADNPPKE